MHNIEQAVILVKEFAKEIRLETKGKLACKACIDSIMADGGEDKDALWSLGLENLEIVFHSFSLYTDHLDYMDTYFCTQSVVLYLDSKEVTGDSVIIAKHRLITNVHGENVDDFFTFNVEQIQQILCR